MNNILSLDGAWDLAWTDHQRGTKGSDSVIPGLHPTRYLRAQVPGEVHLDLERAGIIADVNLGLNVLAARWVEETLWCYRRHFDAPDIPADARVWLVFAGIDHDATIYLNGVEIARHSGAFTPCRIEVTGKITPGENENLLAVQVESGLYAVADKPGAGYSGSWDAILHKRHWLRKPQCQFSWDWSPRLLNVGLHGSVQLEWTTAAIRPDRLVPLVTVSDDLATGTVTARWFLEGLTESSNAEITAEIIETEISVCQAITVAKGLSGHACTLTVSNPRLWWPVGHGPQDRYTLLVTLRQQGTVIAERRVKIGFRRARFDQSPHPDGGRFCVLEINNRRIFCKGGNLVPADMIIARIDRERYAGLIDRALESNFNLLRVWGGGLYEHDDFYDLCDERGILVWQEFIFACSRYPGTDGTFHEAIKVEATHHVRRLAGHPSLVVWCGNNENEWGSWYWGYDKGNVLPDYHIYHLTLPRILAQEDGTRHFQPSSPFSPDHLPPNQNDVGDQHPWDVGFRDTDFRKYRHMTCRFPNEGGILGPNALPTVLECLPEGQRQVGSFAWKQHDNNVNDAPPANSTDRMLTQWTGKDPYALSIPEAVYWMGLVHGEGLTEYVDNFRRRMFSSASAIFWMFNDCWPCTRSWTTVDYRLRRTPAFHPVRRAFATLRLVLVEHDSGVQVFGVNDGPQAIEGELRFGVFALAGGFLCDQRQAVRLAANASTVLATLPPGAWSDPLAQMPFASLEVDGKLVTRNRLYSAYFKDLHWPKAQITVRVVDGHAEFSSATFVWGVCIDLDGEAPLADNFFDLWPGIPYSIPWTAKEPPQVRFIGNLG